MINDCGLKIWNDIEEKEILFSWKEETIIFFVSIVWGENVFVNMSLKEKKNEKFLVIKRSEVIVFRRLCVYLRDCKSIFYFFWSLRSCL